MYLNKEKKERIAELFFTYALWSDLSKETGHNLAYAIKRQAEAIIGLVELGIPYHLEGWAKEVLNNPHYATATYNYSRQYQND